jgi:hypothetical protein
LLNARLVEVIPVPRAALATGDAPNNASLLFGSAPAIYKLSRLGRTLLEDRGILSGLRPTADYGPTNGLFINHALAVTDVYVWARLIERNCETVTVEAWRNEHNAAIDLGETAGQKTLRPDAIITFDLTGSKLVVAVEVDLATERGSTKWLGKLQAYAATFAGKRWKSVTGYDRARVLVISPSIRRRDTLVELVTANAPSELAQRFWFADQSVLDYSVLNEALWRQATFSEIKPLVTVAHGD